MSDECKIDVNQLIARYKQGDTGAFEEICVQYGNMVKSICRAYFLMGGEKEDLIQEGFLGLLKAVNAFDESQNASFTTYAYTCINNNVKKAVRKANSKSNMLLSNAVPLEDVLLVTKVNPEALIIKTESNEEFKVKIKQSLSILEFTVLDYYLSGMSYREIASTINKSIKSVENTLTRIKKKLTEDLKDKN